METRAGRMRLARIVRGVSPLMSAKKLPIKQQHRRVMKESAHDKEISDGQKNEDTEVFKATAL